MPLYRLRMYLHELPALLAEENMRLTLVAGMGQLSPDSEGYKSMWRVWEKIAGRGTGLRQSVAQQLEHAMQFRLSSGVHIVSMYQPQKSVEEPA